MHTSMRGTSPDASRSHAARLDDLLNHIQQRWGTNALRPLRTITAARPPVSTGFPALDSLLGGHRVRAGSRVLIGALPHDLAVR